MAGGRTHLRWQGAAVLGLALAAALPAPGGERVVRSLLEMRRENVVVQEWDLSCGAAALTTVLNHQHGDPVTEREVALGLIGHERYLAQPELVRLRHGFSLLDLKRYVEGRGYSGIGYGKLDYDDLLKFAPVIVPIRTLGYNHFVVFRGAWGDRVLLADPAFGNRSMTVARFKAALLSFGELGHVGFVVGRGGERVGPGRLGVLPQDFVTLR